MENRTAVQGRKRNRVVVGGVAAVLTAALVAGAGYWWHERNEPSQASQADCRMAQTIIDQAKDIASGPAADAERWERETAAKRRKEMKDGYLGFSIAQYEAWAVLSAEKAPGVPSGKDVKELRENAQGHCSDSGVTLSVPPLAA